MLKAVLLALEVVLGSFGSTYEETLEERSSRVENKKQHAFFGLFFIRDPP